jgi:uncharacterized tellurite resistance protein B-like protein
MLLISLAALAVVVAILLAKVVTNGERRPSHAPDATVSSPGHPAVKEKPVQPPFAVSRPVDPLLQRAPAIPSPPIPTKARWISTVEEVTISGTRIAGGFIYFGSGLRSVSGYNTEPALVDPRLRVEGPPKGYCGDDMPYWPSYSDLSPQARGLYIQWLATGRRDSNVAIGIVFLYLYGLERRVLVDRRELTSGELGLIRSEVERLISTYGENSSFRRYSEGLLDVIGASIAGEGENDAPLVTKSWQSPNLALKRGLGRMALKAEPIPASWALAWVRSRDEFSERTPAVRCVDEFHNLFEVRYEGEYGSGVVVKPNKTRLKAAYRPASASFGGEVTLDSPDLPDVTVLKHPIESLVLLAHGCQDELDPFSRFVGRNPQQRMSPAALSLLPGELLSRDRMGSLAGIRGFLDSRIVGDEFAAIRYAELCQSWPELPADPGKRDSVMIGQCLQRLGFAMEPDIRFGNHAIDPKEPMIVFRQSDGPQSASADYVSATLFAHLGAMLAHADGNVSDEEEQRLMQHAVHELDLVPAEARRLQAYMKWLLAAPPELSGLKKRLDATPAAVRAKLGLFLSNLANADGRVTPEEVNLISRMYRLLGLDPDQAFRDIHAAATEPVQVAAPKTGETAGFAIPAKPSAGARSVVDLAKVQSMQAESDGVAALLRNIFMEEVKPAPTPTVKDDAESVLGLDTVHSRFVLKLVSAEQWPRQEIIVIAEQIGLMPNGAIDVINEIAMDRVNELLIEGDDPVVINLAIREELGL